VPQLSQFFTRVIEDLAVLFVKHSGLRRLARAAGSRKVLVDIDYEHDVERKALTIIFALRDFQSMKTVVECKYKIPRGFYFGEILSDANDTARFFEKFAYFVCHDAHIMNYVTKDFKHIKLPYQPKRKWTGARGSGKPFKEALEDFISEVYGEFIGNGLTLAYIYEKDHALYAAINTYQTRFKQKIPFDIPSERELVDRRFAKAVEEGLPSLARTERRSVAAKLRRDRSPP
jgi:hypothetical protein